MKNHVWKLLGLLVFGAAVLFAQTDNYPPKPTTMVSDLAQVMTPDQRDALEAKLRDYRQKTAISVVVVTIPSLGGDDVDSYTNGLFHYWGVGQKGKDNGIMLLLAPNDGPRGKLRIEVGYGLEAYMTDADAGEIRDKNIKPLWEKHDHAGAINAGVDAIISRLDDAGASKAQNQPTPAAPNDDGGGALMYFIIAFTGLALAVLAGLLDPNRKKKNKESERDSPREEHEESGDRDDDSSSAFVAGAVLASELSEPSHSSDDDDTSSDSSSSFSSSDSDDSSSGNSSSDSGAYDGGDSGGGGASGEL